jgi:beta-N-acetylhexosaminidase
VLVTGWGFTATRVLTDNLSARGLPAQRVWTGNPTPQDIADAVAAARTNDIVVDLTMNAWADPGQQDLVAALRATGKPVVVAAIGGPYDIAYFPTAPTYVATYDFLPVSIDPLTATLLGTNPTGRLPVTVRNPAGDHVLFRSGAGIGYPSRR